VSATIALSGKSQCRRTNTVTPGKQSIADLEA
jgi:hypothetical protein